jgi:hypothetical protein
VAARSPAPIGGDAVVRLGVEHPAEHALPVLVELPGKLARVGRIPGGRVPHQAAEFVLTGDALRARHAAGLPAVPAR